MIRHILMAISLTVLIGATSCKTGCEIEDIATGAITGAIVSQLQCKNTAEVKKDVKALLDKTGICYQQGSIADLICPVLASYVVSELKNQVPADWECSMVDAGTNLVVIITSSCKLLPF